MRRGAMTLEGGIVLILFIDKEPARIGLVLMHLIHEAARFFTRFGCEFFKNRGHVGLASDFCHPGYGQYYHPSLHFSCREIQPRGCLILKACGIAKAMPDTNPHSSRYLSLSLALQSHRAYKFRNQNRLLAIGPRGNHSHPRSSFLFDK